MIKPKKSLGQHFLKEEGVANKIVNSLQLTDDINAVIEVGPGMGVLTKHLISSLDKPFFVVEIDDSLVDYLQHHFPQLKTNIIHKDFLQMDFNQLLNGKIAIIGNFPYNISSQIMFKVLDNRNMVNQVVGMFQKEVAHRLASPPGSKDYGISGFVNKPMTMQQMAKIMNEGEEEHN